MLKDLVDLLQEERTKLEPLDSDQLSRFCHEFYKKYFSVPAAAQTSLVNEIIVKSELRRFQKLIENRAKGQNALLKADTKRIYPICHNESATNLCKDLYHISEKPQRTKSTETIRRPKRYHHPNKHIVSIQSDSLESMSPADHYQSLLSQCT